MGIDQSTVRPVLESCRRQQGSRSFQRFRRMRNRRIDPAIVAWCDLSPQRGCTAVINQTRNGFAVNGGGDRLTKLLSTEPLLFAVDLRKLAAQIVEVEEKKLVLKSRSQVVKSIPPGFLLFF